MFAFKYAKHIICEITRTSCMMGIIQVHGFVAFQLKGSLQ